MPRVKISGQIDALEKRQAELLAKLKENRAKTSAKKREAEDRRALIAGRAIVQELQENPAGPSAAAILSALNARLSRREDRAAFNLPPLLGKATSENPTPERSPSTVAGAPAATAPQVDNQHTKAPDGRRASWWGKSGSRQT